MSSISLFISSCEIHCTYMKAMKSHKNQILCRLLRKLKRSWENVRIKQFHFFQLKKITTCCSLRHAKKSNHFTRVAKYTMEREKLFNIPREFLKVIWLQVVQRRWTGQRIPALISSSSFIESLQLKKKQGAKRERFCVSSSLYRAA